ncbi:MAG TPA: DUF1223 domain-containing protein [Bryobacteraceae bacterium]|nr:DUF1223 domain-containing protein [Bryobacteraceae bacterium]
MLIKLSSLAIAVALFAMAAEHNTARVPVLVELFTSEGCSSCPPADRLLEALDQKQPVAGAELIVLSEHVDYWDRLGWKDPFSSSKYTARQQDYAERLKGDGGVYTPQMVVDGRFGFVGSDGSAAGTAIQKAMQEQKIPIQISNVERDGNQVTARIDVPAGGRAQGVLYVAIADNRAESQVARGENAGHTLAHVAVTRVLSEVGVVDTGAASMKQISLKLPAGTPASGSRLVAFIQDARSGHILAAAAQKF